jgi:hypothetical protein
MNRKQIVIALSAAAVSLSAFAASAAEGRTIHVTPATKAINVEYGETVNLDVNGTTQTIRFDRSAPVQNLQNVAPGAPSIPVYVTPSNRYIPDSGG